MNFSLFFLALQFLLPLSIPLTAAQIPPGSSLSAAELNRTWGSPNGTFSVGFTQLAPDSFLAGVNYNGGVPIWTAGGASAAVDSAATFRFTPAGSLLLVNGSGSTVWDSNTARLGATSASIDDSGNFVLRNNGSRTVWSTFANPTDTIVPSQNFTSNQTLASGVYSFRLLSTGNLTLTWNGSITYWNQGLNSSVDSNLTSPNLGLQPIGVAAISDPTLRSPYIVAYSRDYGEGSDILRFLKLDSDGNLRIYSSGRGSGTVTMRWAAVSDQCQVFGYCGNMGICSYNVGSSNPICGCPSQYFEPVDRNDGRKGCRRRVEIQDCAGSATMLQLDNARFLTYQPELSSQAFWVGISACRLNCLVSGSCLVSTSLSDGTGLCYLKTSEFVSGYHKPSLPSTSYVKVCGSEQPKPTDRIEVVGGNKEWKMKGWVVAVVVLSTLAGLIAGEAGVWWWCCRNSPSFGYRSAHYALLEYASGAPVQFSYKELHRSTNGFKEKLGAGGFGAVYKGVLTNKTAVAVKQLEGIEQGERQFRMEVATISNTHHLNLVRLIGFCSEGRHRLLVYELMKNSSLDSFLFSSSEETQSGKFMNWGCRFNIAIGTARGITYLHEECRDCIVHCDIKPENILLDDSFNAKVSDFGLAKLVNPNDHRYRTLKSVRGTRGYLAPEWLANLPITAKSDVYSFGMVLLEIVSGRRNFEVSERTGMKKFTSWAYEEFAKENVTAIVDRRLLSAASNSDLDMEQVARLVGVGFWCIQEQPSARPTMGKVVLMLEGITEFERPPVPRVLSEGSMSGGTSSMMTMSSNVSAPPSTFAPASSSSSANNPAIVVGASGGKVERASSSLLRSEEA